MLFTGNSVACSFSELYQVFEKYTNIWSTCGLSGLRSDGEREAGEIQCGWFTGRVGRSGGVYADEWE